MDDNQLIILAKKTLDDVETANHLLLDSIQNFENLDPEINFTINGRAIDITCFGVFVKASASPVFNGHEFVNEYLFKYGAFSTEEHEIYRFYLTKNGVLYSDPNLTERICDFNSQSIEAILKNKIFISTLRSNLFKPSVK